jgi:hypothetical protein
MEVRITAQHPLVHWLYGDALRLISRLPSSVIASMKQKQSIKDKTLKQARVLGFVVARNMEFGMAGFVLDAVVTFAMTISAIDRNSIQQGDWNDECPQSCDYFS